jgi:eukaryotic-like serine/threonine-protein kinase
MGRVYLALSDDRSHVAVKTVRSRLAEDPDFVTMLLDEACIALRLRHPNIVRTIDVGEDGGRHFIVMEYLDGQPLHRILRRSSGSFLVEMHLWVIARMLDGLHYAHELRTPDGVPLDIVHRDVTPHNAIVTYEGETKLVDFGIAQAAGRVTHTGSGPLKGKASYVAPERILGLPYDRRADVYAVGVMLYEAATRSRMWAGWSEVEILTRVARGQIPSSPRARVSSVDEELERICRRALAFRPEDRHATAAELAAELEAYFRSHHPRLRNRDIGDYVASLFAEKRALAASVLARAELDRETIRIR